MKPFQASIFVIFGILALAAVFIFASFSGGGASSVGTVAIWGTVPKEQMEELVRTVNRSVGGLDDVSYRELPAGTFLADITDAIASGRGPDLVIIPAEAVVGSADKIIPISYRSVSRRAFQDAYVEAGETYLAPGGILGIPFVIDPFVMYWNRSIFSAAGIPRPLRYWDELTDMAPRLSAATEAGTLTRSAVALGGWDNVAYAKEVFLSLIAGLGNPAITRVEGSLVVTLAAEAESGAGAALRFYADFADPAKDVYSWNRSRPLDREAFLAGTLAAYFAPAGEAAALRAANPNLNFDVAAYPLTRGGAVKVPARLYAFSVPRGSKNAAGALKTALILSGADAQKTLAAATGLPSVRRDVLAVNPENPYDAIFRDAALNAFVFLDPDPAATDAILKTMVEDVASGRRPVLNAVHEADAALRALIQ